VEFPSRESLEIHRFSYHFETVLKLSIFFNVIHYYPYSQRTKHGYLKCIDGPLSGLALVIERLSSRSLVAEISIGIRSRT